MLAFRLLGCLILEFSFSSPTSAKIKSNSHFSLKSLFGHGEREVKHLFLDPQPGKHFSPTHYLYAAPQQQSQVFRYENYHAHPPAEQQKFDGYHYEKPAVNLQHLFSEKSNPFPGKLFPFCLFQHKLTPLSFHTDHDEPCVHINPIIHRDDYVGPTPLTEDIWATGTHDGITVKRHIENGRSLRIESGGFLPPLEPSLPIDEHGNPLKNENVQKK